MFIQRRVIEGLPVSVVECFRKRSYKKTCLNDARIKIKLILNVNFIWYRKYNITANVNCAWHMRNVLASNANVENKTKNTMPVIF
jgi:hypothetical protein